MIKKSLSKFILTLVATGIVLCSCSGKVNNSQHQQTDSIKVEVRIIDKLPVGWGVQYKAAIEKAVWGNVKDFGDTIFLGITASEYQQLNTGEGYVMTFYNSEKVNDKKYLPAVTGTVSDKNEIWLISAIENIRSRHDEKRMFPDTAIIE